MRVPPIPQLVLYALVIVLCGALVVSASTSGAAFGAYNPAWDGTSEVRGLAQTHSDSTLTLSTDRYQSTEASNTLAVILAPSESYTQAELTTIHEFVADGGTLLVADNFDSAPAGPPYGNTILESVGATARFDGALLRDEQNYYRSPVLPVATNVSTHPYTDDVSELSLNYATAIELGDAETLVSTSAVAYLDRNRSGTLDGAESVGRYPVVGIESVGNGSVVTVSDPSVFINGMIDQGGNSEFAIALFTAHQRVIIDYSVGGATPPLAVVTTVIGTTPLLQGLLGGGSMLIIWFIAVRPHAPVWALQQWANRLPEPVKELLSIEMSTDLEPSAQPSKSELIAYLHEEHPDWERSRIEQIVASINQDEEDKTTNE